MFIMAHQLVCWVPREWLASSWNSLQVVLFEEMSLQFYNHGTIEGTAIRVGNTTAYLRYHGQHFWMCKDSHRGQEVPHFKEYYAFSIFCIHCAGPYVPFIFNLRK